MNPSNSPRHPIGVSRRELLQVGYSGLVGLGLSSTIRAETAQSPGSKQAPKSVIVVFLTGAMSHIDTFDPKPDAVSEVRGQYGVINTKVPGYQVGELLPKMAARADKYAVVRTLSHRDNNHTAATHHIITGAKQPGVRFDKPLSRDDWPVFASGLSFLKPRHDGVPTGVTLPTFLQEGPLVWPGQHAGFLGPKHDPWQIKSDPNSRNFKVDDLSPISGFEIEQLNDRMALLDGVNRQQRTLGESLEGKRLTEQQQKAASILTSGKVAKAFDIHKESEATRSKYGRHMFGQSLLLARRLIEAGVSVVQANMGRVQNWDHHGDIFPALKRNVPPLDTAVAALLDDLGGSGLLDETLVVMIGDFGRTPKVINAGRDHWAPCFSAVFAGAGVKPGKIIGRSDKIGGYPVTPAYSPDDVGATIYHVLGIDPASEVHDRFNRPVQLNRGEVMHALFNGA
ncbi:MAG TPA: DUF1501 domain-containing protein [Urbifossiella sp.]